MAAVERAHVTGEETSTAEDLQKLTEALECIDWGDVDNVSSITAATFAGQIREALDEC